MNRAALAIKGLFWGGLVCAQSNISVRVCNSVHVPEKILEQGKAEAGFVLQTGGLEATWLDCSTETMQQAPGPMDFILGLVAFRLSGADPAGRRTLASTSTSDREKQSFVWVNYDAIRKTAQDHGVEWQTYQILGYSIAHDIRSFAVGRRA